MADVAAKREARRRRILENLEYRLQRITGRITDDESSDERCKKIVEPQTTSSFNRNGMASEELMEHQSVDSLIDDLGADIEIEDSTENSLYTTEHDIFTEMSAQNVPHRRNTSKIGISSENGNIDSMKLNTSNDARFNSEHDCSPADSLLDNSKSDFSNVKSNPPTSLFITILSSRLIYVILAIFVNIAVITKLEHSFGTSIIIPFFVITIGRLSLCKNDESARGNNMLVAALILSNVRPDFVKIIHKLRGLFSLISEIFRDLAIYIFTFVLFYAVLCRYRNDLDDMPFLEKETDGIYNDDLSM